ncbi:YugN family protein [Radiobacillus sp. PE A8.2]|uniref:YugN family protein n=1 Tax=Radiobacillus sp. PE A8.2 TaxID=3380349 RepID=UPI003890822B
MKIENTGIEGAVVDLKPLDHLMDKIAFVRAGQWDYERVTYDYKIGAVEKNITYYVRIQAYALEGDVDRGNAVLQLTTPLLGKHYYPHGLEYGEQENFPESVVDRAKTLLSKAKEEIDKNKK